MITQKDKYILMIGCFDTKEENFNFLRQCILSHGESVISMNTGIFGSTSLFPVELESDLVATEAGESIEGLRKKADRGYAVEVMGKGAGKLVSRLLTEGKIKAVIGMGGGGGTYIALAAMEPLPIGFPKLCISTLATKDVSRQVGFKDIFLVPSIVDIAGLNKIISPIIMNAASAICSMSNTERIFQEKSLGVIAVSMFGNTTPCVNQATRILEERGYETMVFHANGLGGKAMEDLIRENCFIGVLDITTTELADELCGGICSAGPDRLTAASEMGIPQLVVPGCMDMVNFSHKDTVPVHFSSRQLYSWAPDVTLMRTNGDENLKLGEIMAEKLNKSNGPIKVVLPLKGLSQIDKEGGVFYNPKINRVLFESIKNNLQANIKIEEVEMHINDLEFSELIANQMIKLIELEKN
jgi:uncharacterized protein (UPF0261 family)